MVKPLWQSVPMMVSPRGEKVSPCNLSETLCFNSSQLFLTLLSWSTVKRPPFLTTSAQTLSGCHQVSLESTKKGIFFLSQAVQEQYSWSFFTLQMLWLLDHIGCPLSNLLQFIDVLLLLGPKTSCSILDTKNLSSGENKKRFFFPPEGLHFFPAFRHTCVYLLHTSRYSGPKYLSPDFV